MIYSIPTDTCFWLWCPLYSKEDFLKIYLLKNRESNKPLSFAVKNFSDLKNIIILTNEQVVFLKKYKRPFTVVWELNPSFKLPQFLDKKIYSKIAVRVWELTIKKDILSKIPFPIFLTSANISWDQEIYSSDESKKIFNWEDIFHFDWKIDIMPPSDIFYFEKKSLEPIYIRKNY